MLNEKTIQLVKSTALSLQASQDALSGYFYHRMFQHNPEVLPFFNQAHQAVGNQQRALAGAITACAAHLDTIDCLHDELELIAHKHVSLNIKPEQYPIVRDNLLAAIRHVLGQQATDEVLQAWSDAYHVLAHVLINREQQIYAENAHKPGGWQGFKRLRIVRKQKESSIITSFYLATFDGEKLPLFKPGQYITVRTTTPNGSTTMRNYSLSDKPGQDWLRISVKREPPLNKNAPAGYVSNLLHDQIQAGDTLEVTAPCGDFFLDQTDNTKRPLVLLAAGVGITPIFSMLNTAVETMPERQIIFVHAAFNEDVQAFGKTADDLAKKYANLQTYHRYSGPGKRSGHASTGRVTASYLQQLLPERDADYYFCGPQPFMVSLYHNLRQWNVPHAQLHFEFFGPRQDLEHMAA